MVVAREDGDEHQAADERAPALVGEDVREERASPAQVRAFGRDGRGHGVIPADSDAEDDTPDRKPEDAASGREVTWVEPMSVEDRGEGSCMHCGANHRA